MEYQLCMHDIFGIADTATATVRSDAMAETNDGCDCVGASVELHGVSVGCVVLVRRSVSSVARLPRRRPLGRLLRPRRENLYWKTRPCATKPVGNKQNPNEWRARDIQRAATASSSKSGVSKSKPEGFNKVTFDATGGKRRPQCRDTNMHTSLGVASHWKS